MIENPDHPATESKAQMFTESVVEKFSHHLETGRLWITRSWQIALLMAKGAYLTTERRRLFGKLGEEVYFKIQKGELHNTELERVVEEIDRLSKKLEVEELQIRAVRFGEDEENSSESPASNRGTEHV